MCICLLSFSSRQGNLLILFFVGLNLSLVLEFGKTSRPLLIHFLLQVLPLHSVLLIHLLQDVELVSLASKCFFGRPRFVLGILLGDCCLHLIQLVFLEPVGLALLLLLEQYVFLTGLVNVFQQVYPGLVLTLPLRVPHFILSFSLFGHFFFDKFFEGCLVICT